MMNEAYAQILRAAKKSLELVRADGLDPYEVEFQLVDQDTLHYLVSGSLPFSPPYWGKGRDYLSQRSRYERGLGKIHEVVFNTDPNLALLSDSSSLPINVMTVVHVWGHSHVNKVNLHQSRNRPHVQDLRDQYFRIWDYIERYGLGEVEPVLELGQALALQSIYMDKVWKSERESLQEQGQQDTQTRSIYGPLYSETLTEELRDHSVLYRSLGVGMRNLTAFLISHSPVLEDWSKDILEIQLRHFELVSPIIRTKTLHEGFSTWVHRKYTPYLAEPGWEVELSMADARLVGAPIYFEFEYDEEDRLVPILSHISPYALGYWIMAHLESRGGVEGVLEVVKYSTDLELFSIYFDEEFYHTTFRRALLSHYQRYEEVLRRRLFDYDVAEEAFKSLQRLLISNYSGDLKRFVPEVYVDLYDPMSDKDRWEYLKGVGDPLLPSLYLTSEDPLDRDYASTMVRLIQKAWGGYVHVRWPKSARS